MPQKGKEAAKTPNILVIWGDDIGISNLSCYSHGLMGYQTPNIDRLAKEGMMFIDSYGEQSCTAGRSSFITGQSVYRTGLSKVGIPGAPIGMNEQLVTIAGCLKNQGYATGQFGKNHLGDLNKHLPTNHGFDEFFGNLYHLNAEEEPEMYDYFTEKDFPEFRKTVTPRGVLKCWATDKDDATVQERWGRVGKQRIEDTGPLTKKRMETCDDEFAAAAKVPCRYGRNLSPGCGCRRSSIFVPIPTSSPMSPQTPTMTGSFTMTTLCTAPWRSQICGRRPLRTSRQSRNRTASPSMTH